MMTPNHEAVRAELFAKQGWRMTIPKPMRSMNTVSQMIRTEGFFINGGRRVANSSTESSDRRWRAKGDSEGHGGPVAIEHPARAGGAWSEKRPRIHGLIEPLEKAVRLPGGDAISRPGGPRLVLFCHRFVGDGQQRMVAGQRARVSEIARLASNAVMRSEACCAREFPLAQCK